MPVGHAWRWEDSELEAVDELALRIDVFYQKAAEGKTTISEQILELDRLIAMCKEQKRNATGLENERERLVRTQLEQDRMSTALIEQASRLFKRTLEVAQAGRYTEALQSAREAERLNSKDKILSDIRHRLEMISAAVSEVPEAGKVPGLVRDGAFHFLKNDPRKAVLSLSYAYQLDPKNLPASLLLNLVQKVAPEGEDLLDPRFNIVDQKLQIALEKIYSGQYMEAVRHCQDVLELEPNNTLALTRMGSAYYAMGDLKQAERHWQQAYKIDPSNGVVKEFLDSMAKNRTVQTTPAQPVQN